MVLPPQPSASRGLKIPPKPSLADLLEAMLLDIAGLVWRAECVNDVRWDGYESPWAASWDAPMLVSHEQLRQQAADGRQVINGRFTALIADVEVVTVEAIDSTFWLLWSDQDDVLRRVRHRFLDATDFSPPSPWHPHG